MEFKLSDHKPVSATFDIQVCRTQLAGHESSVGVTNVSPSVLSMTRIRFLDAAEYFKGCFPD